MIVDTSVVVAAFNSRDLQHQRCAHALQALGVDVLLPGLCLAEIDYWLRSSSLFDQAQQVVENVDGSAWGVSWPSDAEFGRAVELSGQRPDLGLVDTCLLALAEARRESVVASLDHRHLATVELAHGFLQLAP